MGELESEGESLVECRGEKWRLAAQHTYIRVVGWKTFQRVEKHRGQCEYSFVTGNKGKSDLTAPLFYIKTRYLYRYKKLGDGREILRTEESIRCFCK